MENKKGLQNLNLDLPSQVEYNRQKNVTQDQAISTLSSQVQEILSQRPSGFLPRVYYGLTRGAQTYRFIQDWVVNVPGLTGNIGDAYEFDSSSETQNYIPAVGVMINATQLKITIPGDYNVSTTEFDIINMRDGSSVTEDIGSVLSTQPASYLGDFNPDNERDKQVTVLYDLETNTENVVFASVDLNSDEVYNWIRIGSYTNGVDGTCIFGVSSATISAVLGAAKVGDVLVAGEAFTEDGVTFAIGDLATIDTLSPFAVTMQGNVRGPQGDQGDQGDPGTNGTNGYTPYIQADHWYINGVDTGVVAVGQDGNDGQNGQSFQMHSGLYSVPANWGLPGNVDGDGNALLQLPTLPQASGMTGYAYVVYDPLTTPLEPFYDLYYCNDNDNDWTIIHPFSGLKGADGNDGYTPYISGGYWYINGTNTGVPATGPQGNDGYTPYIQSDHWYINGVDTGVTAVGQNGTNGTNGTNGQDGVTPDISITATQLAEGASPTVVKTGTLENPVFTFGIPKGDTGEGVPSGGTTGQYLRKTSNSNYATEWHTLSSGDVTTALGYTPYNSTNPSGYITSSALSGYAAKDASNITATTWAQAIHTWEYVNSYSAGSSQLDISSINLDLYDYKVYCYINSTSDSNHLFGFSNNANWTTITKDRSSVTNTGAYLAWAKVSCTELLIKRDGSAGAKMYIVGGVDAGKYSTTSSTNTTFRVKASSGQSAIYVELYRRKK